MDITERLSLLEQRVSALELDPSFSRRSSSVSQQTSNQKEIRIQAHFGRNALERMPFSVTLGIPQTVPNLTRSLTPVRAAIFLALLVDLSKRSEGAKKQESLIDGVVEALKALTPNELPTASSDALRVALHRASQFLEEEFGTVDKSIAFSVENGSLALTILGEQIPVSNIEVEVTSSDETISSFLDRSFATSPLSRLRKEKALFVPPGEEGQDRLLLELLDHEFPVKQTCLFYRPTVQSFPEELLVKFRLSPNRRRRQQVAITAYQSGRIHYTEILPRRVFRDLLNTPFDGAGTLYPPGTTAVDVIRHLDHLIFLVRNIATYELILTDAFFPFYITTVESTRRDEIERTVLFFQHGGENNLHQVSVFALKDDQVFFSTHERIVHWVLSHPTTTRSKEGVLGELESVRSQLLETTRANEQVIRADSPFSKSKLAQSVSIEKND